MFIFNAFLHLVASKVVGGGFGWKGMVEEQLEERETLRKVSEANHWFQASVIGQIDGADDTSDEEDDDFQDNDDDNDDQNEDDIGAEDESQMKDYQREVEESRIAKEELATQVKESEKKQKTLEAELIQLQEDLALSERARKSAESERDELHEEINNSTSKGEKQNIAKSSRKLQKRVKELLLQLDDERRHADQYKEQYLEKEGVSVTLEDIGKQTMPDGSILPLPPILLGTSGNDPKKKTVCIYGHLDVQPAALYCAQIWLGKYDSKSGEADFSTPDKRREFMRLKYEEKKFYVDPREAIKKMKPPGPVAPTSALLLSLSPKATL